MDSAMVVSAHAPSRRSSFVEYLIDTEEEREVRTKRFQNGDRYEGAWGEGLPYGDGKYTWKDGSVYDGTWQRGLRHGVGQYVWGVSRATYQGEWRDGHMHGVGTLEARRDESGKHYVALPKHMGPNTSTTPRYQGGWHRGQKQGLGKQQYGNGDMYEGLWRGGLQHGPGRYLFAGGSEYDGQWLGGLMHGMGTFVWASGERYDGHWKLGQPDGMGSLVLPDGSQFESQWQAGLRHGACLFRLPAGQSKLQQKRSLENQAGNVSSNGPVSPNKEAAHSWLQPNFLRRPSHKQDNSSANSSRSFTAAQQAAGSSPLNSIANPAAVAAPVPISLTFSQLPVPGDPPSSSSPTAGGSSSNPLLTSNHGSFSHSHPPHAPHAFLREYENGLLVREWPMAREDVDSVLPLLGSSKATVESSTIGRFLKGKGKSKRDHNGGGNGSNKMGEALAKGHQSYEVMLNLQLGIRYSVTRVTSEAAPELSTDDYLLKIKQYFPRQGGDVTPVHSTEDFMWKDYAPLVFRKLREMFDVEAGSYMDSLCSDAAVRLLNSPGKSGSVFFLSHDDRFFIKTIKKSEAKLLYSRLPVYYRHMSCHPHSLLTKFYGLHCVKAETGKKMYVVVMQNLFPDPLLVQVHTKYDLKGSRLGRTIGLSPDKPLDPHIILKDLDLDMTFRLEPEWLERLEFQLRSDCALLQSCQIMDYSLMLGVTYRSRATGILKQDNVPAVTPAGQWSSGGSARMRPINFAEVTPESEYNMEFPRLCEKVARSKLPDEARKCLLKLARTRLAEGPGAKAVARRSQCMEYGTPAGLFEPAGVGADTAADQLALQLGLSHTQLGVNMPAVACPMDRTDGRKPEEVVLSFGIIDILQDYNPSKRLEHSLKSIVHDSYSISVTHPSTYAQRFQSFLRSIFT